MKTLKRSLALLLSLLLLFGFGAPAMAEEDAPDFVWSYVHRPQSTTVAHGEEIVLRVEVQVTEGIEARYWWTRWDNSSIVAEGPELRITPDSPHYPQAFRPIECARGIFQYHIAFYRENDQGEMEEFYTHDGQIVWVTVQAQRGRNIFEWVGGVLLAVLMIPMAALMLFIMMGAFSWGMGWLLFPITLPLAILFAFPYALSEIFWTPSC